MPSEAQKRAALKYRATHTVKITIELNKSTDADILEKLESVPNKAGYVKQLIQHDLKGVKKNENSY